MKGQIPLPLLAWLHARPPPLASDVPSAMVAKISLNDFFADLASLSAGLTGIGVWFRLASRLEQTGLGVESLIWSEALHRLQ